MKTENLLSGTTRRLAVQHLSTVRFGLLALIALAFSACTPTYSPPVGVPTRAVVEVPSGDPAISISPTSGSAGVYVQVTGEDWPEGSLVLVALRDQRGRSGILAASTADTAGTISTGFLYPISPRWLAAGTHTVLAYTSDGRHEATALFQTGEDVEVADTATVTTDTTAAQEADTANASANAYANGATNAYPVGNGDDHACAHADAVNHHRLARRLLEQSKPVGTAGVHTQRSGDLLQLGRGNGR